jgi:hypothetical protein
MLQTKLVEKIKTHFVSSHFFSSKNRAVYEMWGKYHTAGQATGDKTAHAHCVLDN